MIDLLKRVRLGSSERDIQAAFTDWTPMPPHPTQHAIGFLGQYEGRPVAVICYFVSRLFSAKLGRAVLNLFPERPADADAETLHRRLKQELTSAYGRPISDQESEVQQAPPEFRMSAMTVWMSGDAVITLALALKRHGVSPTVPTLALGIADRRLDPTAKMMAASAQ